MRSLTTSGRGVGATPAGAAAGAGAVLGTTDSTAVGCGAAGELVGGRAEGGAALEVVGLGVGVAGPGFGIAAGSLSEGACEDTDEEVVAEGAGDTTVADTTLPRCLRPLARFSCLRADLSSSWLFSGSW